MNDEKMRQSEMEMMEIARHVSEGDIWRHVRSGRRYRILSLGVIEKTLKPVVIYSPLAGFGLTWVRPAKEFLDGRFVRMEGERYGA